MRIIILKDQISHKLNSVSEAVIYAAMERHIDCEPLDLSGFLIAPSKTSCPDYIRKISEYIRQEKADAVVCTGSFSMKLMTAVKAQENHPIYCYGIIGEYFCPPSIASVNLDCYFVPHEEIKTKLVRKGIPQEKIFVTGIPVKKSFRERIGKAAARNYLVIPRQRRVYLLLAEGLSETNIRRLCQELAESETNDYVFYIPTPRCSEIRDRLMRFASGDPHIQIITYTQKLNVYIQSADAILLRPDHIFCTEAAVSGVPMVHVALESDTGNEKNNFFVSHEMAVIGNGIRDTIRKAKRFAEEKAMAARVIQMQYRNISSDAAEKIIEIIQKTCQKTSGGTNSFTERKKI